MNWSENNQAAEESVIGALIGSAGDKVSIFDKLSASDFFDKRLGNIFKSAEDLHADGTDIDYTTVSADLNDEDFTWLGMLIKNCPSGANIFAYAKIVRDKSLERDTLAKLYEAESVIKGGGKTQEKAAEVVSLISKIDANDNEDGPQHVKEIALEWLDTYEERISDDAPKGLKTGIDGLDALFGNRGVGDTDMVVVGGRSKMGKSALATMIASEVAYSGKHTLVFSMEMPKTQIFERFLTQDAKVSGDHFYREMDDYEFARVNETVSKMISSNLYIDDRPNLSLNQIKSACKKHQDEHGELGAVFVDYFTLMKIQSAARHDLAHGANSTGLKNMAKEIKVPVFLLAQLSRGVDSRPNKRPLISDMRESGSLEQDADAIIFLYKDSVYNPDNGLGGLTEVALAANRHGETGTAFVEMKGGWFENVSENDVNHMMNFAGPNEGWSG